MIDDEQISLKFHKEMKANYRIAEDELNLRIKRLQLYIKKALNCPISCSNLLKEVLELEQKEEDKEIDLIVKSEKWKAKYG